MSKSPKKHRTVEDEAKAADFINLPPRKLHALFLKAAKHANAMQRDTARKADRLSISKKKVTRNKKAHR